jgi:tetratricopeptide (TPR) repeat protein
VILQVKFWGERSSASSIALLLFTLSFSARRVRTNRLLSRPILLDYPGKGQVFRGNISFSNVPGIRRGPCRPTAHVRLTALLAGAVVISQILSPVISLAQRQSTPPPASRGSSNSSALLDQAKKLVQGGDAQGALSVLQDADIHGANASDIHAVRGICLALLSKPIESAAEFEQAIRLRPNYAPNYFSSGLAYATFNNLDRALDRLSVALKLDPSLPGVRYNYALVLARAGKYAESEKEVNLELESKGPRTESPLDLSRLKARDAYYQKKWQDTIDAYRKTLDLGPEWPEAYAAVGEALFSLNRSEESTATLEKAASLDPENEVPHALLGKLYQDSGKQDKAITELETAHRLAPTDREVTYRLYRIYSLKGDSVNTPRLQKDLEDLLASTHAEADSETKAMVLNNSGIELEKKGDLAGALEHYDQAAKTDVSNLVFQRNAALVLCKSGRAEEAIRRLRDILSIDADDAETLQILAVANEVAAGRVGVKRTLPAAQASH